MKKMVVPTIALLVFASVLFLLVAKEYSEKKRLIQFTHRVRKMGAKILIMRRVQEMKTLL